MTVHRSLTTTVDDAGHGFLHLVAGRRTDFRFTDRLMRTIESKGYRNFKDLDGDALHAEDTTRAPKPLKAITLAWTRTSGTGKCDGISGKATDPNSGELDDAGSPQAGAKVVGADKIRRAAPNDVNAMVAPHDPPERKSPVSGTG